MLGRTIAEASKLIACFEGVALEGGLKVNSLILLWLLSPNCIKTKKNQICLLKGHSTHLH